MDAVLVIDQDLVTEAVRTLSLNTLTAYRNGVSLKWHDAELAVYLVYIFGEINKCTNSIHFLSDQADVGPSAGGKGRAAFCLAPATDKDKRKLIDYSEYSLTNHGEMLLALVQSGISAYPHRTVVIQFFETTARYGDFFKVRKGCIIPTLEAMVDARYELFLLAIDGRLIHLFLVRGLHSQSSTVRSRVFYLFHRFIKDTKNDIPVDLAVNLLDGIRDVLTIQVEIPDLEDTDQQSLLTEAVNNPGLFDAQLYIFETAGILVSLLYKASEQQAPLLLSIVKPLLDGLSTSLHATTKDPREVLPILEVHHIIMALGNIAKGFPDYPSPVTEGYILPPLDIFGQVAQAILVCLEAMNVFKVVRDAVCSVLRKKKVSG